MKKKKNQYAGSHRHLVDQETCGFHLVVLNGNVNSVNCILCGLVSEDNCLT